MLNILTGKTKEQILEDAISSNFPLPKFIEFVKHWEKEYSEKIPEEIYPLIFMFLENLVKEKRKAILRKGPIPHKNIFLKG